MKCLTYARVSTDKQAEKELSPPAQLSAMRQYARQRDWQIVEEFMEPGASARTADRPELKRLLGRCREATPRIDAVIVHKLDRLARNLADHVALRAFLTRAGVRLVSVSENLDDSVSGQLVEHIMASIAEFYSANLGEEVKKGMRQKVLQGGWPHLPPRGYVLRRDELGRSRVEPDQKLAPAMRRAFELAAQGFRGLEVRLQLARLGLTSRNGGPIDKNGVNQILRNPFCRGVVRWKGQEHRGNHPPLVSEELFAASQARLGHRRHQRGPTYLLTGIARCGNCGGFLTAERHRQFAYYRCRNNVRSRNRCRVPFSRIDQVHAAMFEVLANISDDADSPRTHRAAAASPPADH